MDNKSQKGFIFRQENCVGCGGCTVACQIHNELPEAVRFRKVDQFEVKKGDITVDVWLSHLCMHCSNPTCLSVCPAGAYTKRPDGIVVLDRSKCTGCGLCVGACPFNAVTLLKTDGKAAKCNLCVELLDMGKKPACVDGCTVRCLDVGYVHQVLGQKKSASKQGIGYQDGPTRPNMVIIKERV